MNHLTTPLDFQSQTACGLCSYHNPTHRVQVVRITNIQGWYFERVVFPQDRLLFEAPVGAELEIYQGEMNGLVTLWDRLECDRLRVNATNADNLENPSASPLTQLHAS